MSELVDRYLKCWNETDANARRSLIGEVFADDARYVDPLADVTGGDALADAIGGVQAQFAGFVFRPHGEAEAHHDAVRFAWALGPEGEEPVVIGSDVATIAPDGRIGLVVGFLDKVPS